MEDDERIRAGRLLLGRRLRQTRKGAGLTLRETHERVGLSISYISELERGISLPTLASLLMLADAYGCRVDELLAGVYPFGTSRRPRSTPRH